jgi:glutathione S-transferase
MKLIFHPASPYSRKARVTAYEAGLWDELDFEQTGFISPVEPNSTVIQANPLGKIPTLILDDGTCLADSRVICEYFDSLQDGLKLFPEDKNERFKALTLQALGDGLLDASVLIRYETLIRPENLKWSEWTNAQDSRVSRVLDHFNTQCDEFKDKFNIGTITIAVCLGYLDFRFPDNDWRDGRDNLSNWFKESSNRESMKATIPSA